MNFFTGLFGKAPLCLAIVDTRDMNPHNFEIKSNDRDARLSGGEHRIGSGRLFLLLMNKHSTKEHE